MPKVTVTQVARNFADFVNRVAYRRETFTLVRGNKPLAELRPLPVGSSVLELPDLVSSLPQITPEEAEAFLADLLAAGRARGKGRGEAPDERQGECRVDRAEEWPSTAGDAWGC